MRPHFRRTVVALGLAAVLALVVGCSGIGAQPPDAQDESGAPPFSAAIELSKGTPIYVRLHQSISSSSAEPGQSFPAFLDAPLVVNRRTVAPEGTPVAGSVVAARKSGGLHDAGYLRLTLSAITINGKDIPIQTSSVFVEGGNYKNHSLAFMSGGTENAKADVLDSMIGNADGASAAYVSDKKDVGFAAERRMRFLLIETVRTN
jgi:hypothetical protein